MPHFLLCTKSSLKEKHYQPTNKINKSNRNRVAQKEGLAKTKEELSENSGESSESKSGNSSTFKSTPFQLKIFKYSI